MGDFLAPLTQVHGGRTSMTGFEIWRRAAIASTLLLSACAGDVAVEYENRQAAQEVAHLSKPRGSAYTGWRVFQDRCASCHGPEAGGGSGPDLLPIVRQMGPRRFVGLVLQRYDWNLSPAEASNESLALDKLVEEILQGEGPIVTMPAWEGSPGVKAHILDLYTHLAARADGTQGEGRPMQ